MCSACHADPHGGEFAAAPYSNHCERCHTQDGFRPSTFSAESHARTRFALTGRHATVACNDCHKPPPLSASMAQIVVTIGPGAGPRASRQFHFLALTCNSCHADPHTTRLPCETCHTSRQWKELRSFDHSTTKFPIDGAHQKVACIKCHGPSGRFGGNVAGAPGFSKTPNHCSECHEDRHRGQFRNTSPSKDCSSCHVTVEWKIEKFDHDATRFPLDIAHRNVTCTKCHTKEIEVDGKVVRLYRGAPTQCVQCH